MAKRYIVFCMVICVLVQHVHLRRVEIAQQRARWDEIRLAIGPQLADANPVAAAAAACNPYVLAALVLGTAAVWCWTHGGKEAFILTNQALLNGVAVTKDWVQKEIGRLNGYDVDSTGPDGVSPDKKTVTYNGNVYNVLYYWGTSRMQYLGPVYFKPDGMGYRIGFRPGPYDVVGFCYYNDVVNTGPVVGPAPSAFNPADHPELYTGPALMANCHALAAKFPGLSPIYQPAVASRPNVGNAALDIVPPVYLVAVNPDGTAIDTRGRVWPPLAGNVLDPPKLDTASAGTVVVGGQDVVVGKDLLDKLAAAGVLTGGGSITGAGDGYIDWTGADGTKHHTKIDTSTSSTVQNIVNQGDHASIDPSEPETDPGDPEDTDLPTIPVFEPFAESDWGELKPWPWQDWIGSLPFVDVLKRSRIDKGGSSSSINLNLTLLGQSRAMSYDFAAWETIFNAMGLIIYACSCWYALQLAILKRD